MRQRKGQSSGDHSSTTPRQCGCGTGFRTLDEDLIWCNERFSFEQLLQVLKKWIAQFNQGYPHQESTTGPLNNLRTNLTPQSETNALL